MQFLSCVRNPLITLDLTHFRMDEISTKLEFLELQEKKSSLMEKDIKIDEKLMISKQKLDNIIIEKKELEKEDEEITRRFNKISEEFLKQHRYISESIC